MPRGGHSRGGPQSFDQATRDLRGTRTRRRHRTKGEIGEPLITIDPPLHLTAAQRRVWAYYAPQLVAEGRLPLKARDVLSKYCVAIDTVARLNRRVRHLTVKGEKHPLLGELRQWLAVTRLYENDLLMNPAAAVRAPRPDPPSDDADDQELDAILN